MSKWTVNNTGFEDIAWSLEIDTLNINEIASGYWEVSGSSIDYKNGLLPIIEGSSKYLYDFKVQDWEIIPKDGKCVGNLTLRVYNWLNETRIGEYHEIHIKWGHNIYDHSFATTGSIRLKTY